MRFGIFKKRNIYKDSLEIIDKVIMEDYICLKVK